jgi:alkylated DNA repair dioxygenase AlkB
MKRVAEIATVVEEAWRSLDAEKQATHLLKEDDGASWVTTTRLSTKLMPDKETMAELKKLRPVERSIIKMAGKPVTVPRYNQSYGQAYTFSGATHEAHEIPPLLQPYLDFANQCTATIRRRDYGDRQFNMIFVNWYEDGNHYIGWHSDDEKQLYKNRRGETLVFSISLGQQRRFQLKPREATGGRQHRRVNNKPYQFELASGDCLVMGGLCQSHYKHRVPKEPTKLMGGRINMTFRLFK